jgi:hypothetical protein
MFMRISSLAAIALLTGCGGSDVVPEKADGDEMIACAVEGVAELKPVCAVERSAVADGLILTLHHPSGGFRRLTVTRDGRGVIVSDGSEPATVTPVGADLIEVVIGADRYRLPATVKR